MIKTTRIQILAAGLCLALALAVLLIPRMFSEPENPEPERTKPPLSALASSSRVKALEPEIDALDLSGVLEQLPDKPYRFGLFSDETNPRADQLFARLGALLGAGALDEISRRYGNNAFCAYAMGEALAGWMSVDPQKASEALLEIANSIEWHDGRKDGYGYTFVTIEWNGQSIVINESGDYFDLGNKSDLNHHGQLSPGDMFAEALHTATTTDPELGFSLLADDALQRQFDELLYAYTGGLGAETEWLEVEKKLSDLARSNRGTSIPDALARNWARWDIDTALDWYIGRSERDGRHSQNLTVSLLRSLEDRELAVDWLERNLDKGFVTAETLKNFAGQIRSAEIDGNVRRLVALPSDEKARERILSVFAMPHYEGSERRLSHPPESLNALIEAADLSPKLANYWKSSVESGIYLSEEG